MSDLARNNFEATLRSVASARFGRPVKRLSRPGAAGDRKLRRLAGEAEVQALDDRQAPHVGRRAANEHAVEHGR